MAIFSAIASALGASTAAASTAGAAGAATGISGAAGAIGTAATIVGTGMQVAGQMKANDAAEKAERIRASQMELDTRRQQRQIVRQAVAARSLALSNATAQGAAEGSGIQGGYGQIQGGAGDASVGLQNNAQLGRAMFAANRQMSQGQTMSSIGSGVSSLGGALVKNQDPIGRVGANFLYG